jgi:hypothetical protein
MVLVPVPGSPRVWTLPFLTALSWPAGSRRRPTPKISIDWTGQMVLQVRRWLPEQGLILVLVRPGPRSRGGAARGGVLLHRRAERAGGNPEGGGAELERGGGLRGSAGPAGPGDPAAVVGSGSLHPTAVLWGLFTLVTWATRRGPEGGCSQPSRQPGRRKQSRRSRTGFGWSEAGTGRRGSAAGWGVKPR